MLMAKTARGIVSMSDKIIPGQKSRRIVLPAPAGDDRCEEVGAAETFGAILRQLSDDLGFTSDRAAASVGVSVEWLAQIEGGCSGLLI